MQGLHREFEQFQEYDNLQDHILLVQPIMCIQQ